MLEHRHAVAPGAEFVVAKAERLPFFDATFELITAAGSLNYADANLALAEIARVLVANGTLVIYDFSAGRRFAAGRALEEWYAEFERRYPDAPGYDMDVTRLPFGGAGLVFEALQPFEIAIPMTFDTYLRYVESETRIEYARAAGQDDTKIREWCGRTLQDVFGGDSHDVLFDAYAAYATRPASSSPPRRRSEASA